MPLHIRLDGYFRWQKGTTDYTIPYVHHARKDSDWKRIPYCEGVRYNLYIGPDGRLEPYAMICSNTCMVRTITASAAG